MKIKKAYRIAYIGVLFALSIALSFLESLVPLTGILPPGAKLGLSNVVTMYMLFFVGVNQAFTLAVLKPFFVFLMRGFTASIMSLSGGILSILIMMLFSKISKNHYILSVSGAVFHNLGQLIASVFLLSNIKVMWYLPILLLSGIIMGLLTSLVLKAVLPAMKKIINIDKIKEE